MSLPAPTVRGVPVSCGCDCHSDPRKVVPSCGCECDGTPSGPRLLGNCCRCKRPQYGHPDNHDGMRDWAVPMDFIWCADCWEADRVLARPSFVAQIRRHVGAFTDTIEPPAAGAWFAKLCELVGIKT